MGNEFMIGRDPSFCQIVVPKDESQVSNRHARIVFDGQTITLEDIGSTNGTFVNGIRVVKKAVSPADVITLGATNGYRLDLSQVLGRVSGRDSQPGKGVQGGRAVQGAGNDNGAVDPVYSGKVRYLQQVHDDYHEECAQLSKEQGKALKIRMLPSMVIGSAGAILGAMVPDGYKIPLLVGMGVLTVVVFLITSHIASERMAASARRRKEINEQYELDFVCPECGGSWRSHSFAYIARLGACPCCKKKFQL